jgi:hypothetical protein
MMESENRAGGSWVKPWSTIDHVQSQLLHALSLLRRGLPPGNEVLLTSDEVALIRVITDAIAIVEWIKK